MSASCSFVLDPSGKRPAAALLAGVGDDRRRRFPVKPARRQLPGDDIEYHL
jgi:hypothetical protein